MNDDSFEQQSWHPPADSGLPDESVLKSIGEGGVRNVLDKKYLIVRTIGEGRYAK